MKEWQEAEMLEIKFGETNYGGAVLSEFDDIYVNANGEWEGTHIDDAPAIWKPGDGVKEVYHDENGAAHIVFVGTPGGVLPLQS